MINAGIVGASGLTGKELIKILLRHKNARIKYATSRRFAGKKIESLFPEFTGLIEQKFISPADKSIFNDVDLVFLCLPHTESFEFVKKFYQKGIRIIDLSADFRIKDTRTYKIWYKTKHKYGNILKEAVYGLPEILKEKIINAKLVANPGCFATSILLGICPVMDKLNIQDIIIDSKTGISGAGATPTLQTQYINVNENVIPYNFGRRHRHIGEIEDLIFNIYNKKIKIIFTPQIISLDRGILSVIYIKLKKWQKVEKVKEIFKNFYKNQPFVRIVDSVNLHQVQNTNFCDISIDGVKEKETLIIITAIDNLVKGASGQAVQNMNIVYGFNEKEGLI
jgi:N-acetyl-gamma-glutamyl-phosphate reductase